MLACIKRETKLYLFRTNMKNVFLYGPETWKKSKKYFAKFQTAHKNFL